MNSQKLLIVVPIIKPNFRTRL